MALATRNRTPFVALLLGLAWAATARADDATRQNLVERALQELQQAERLYYGPTGARAAAGPARRALVLLDQADQHRSGDTETALLGVQAAVFASDRLRATLWLERYAARTPYRERDPHLHYSRALILLFLDLRADAAIKALDRMKKVGPRTEPRGRDLLLYAALTRQGNRLADLKQYERAIALLARSARTALGLGDRGKELAARANVGVVLRLAGRHEDSLTVFTRLAQEEPKNPVWPWQQALGLLAQKRLADALVPLERVTTRLTEAGIDNPRYATLRRAWLRIGKIHRALARASKDDAEKRKLLDLARKALETFMTIEPGTVAGRFQLGALLFEDFGRPYEAMRLFEAAHGKDPVCDGSLRYLIRIATQHSPPPEKDPARAAEARRAWTARRVAWEKELRENEDRWAAERKRRRARSPDGEDGCR